jgi:hypothetical protein
MIAANKGNDKGNEKTVHSDEEILKVLEEEAERLIKENELSDTKVQFVKKHVKLLQDVFEIKRLIERIEKKLKE